MLPESLYKDLKKYENSIAELQVLDKSGFYFPWMPRNALAPYSASGAVYWGGIINTLNILEYGYWLFLVGPNNATDFWQIKLEKNSVPASTIHTLSTVGLATGSYVYQQVTIGSLGFSQLTTADKGLTLQVTKNGAAGNLFLIPVLYVIP